MPEFEEVPFQDLVDFKEGPGILAKDFRDHGVPLLRLKGLSSATTVLEGCNYLDPDTVTARWAHFRVSPGDLLLSTSASLGRVAVVGPEAEGAVPYTGIIRMRAKPPLRQDFLRYVLQGGHFQAQVTAMGVGSVMNHFGPSHLRRMTLTVPPEAQQARIAELLAVLDDKVRVCRRISDDCVALADAEHAAIQKEAVSWPSSTYGESCEVSGGSTPSTKNEDFWGTAYCWATPTDITGLGSLYLFGTARQLSQAGVEAARLVVHPPGAILMTSRATIGAFAINQVPTATNQGFIVVRPHDPAMKWFTLHAMRSQVEEMLALANGSTFLELSRKNFKRLTLSQPPAEVIGRFNALVDPLHGRAVAAVSEAATLTALRDTLLPRLLSGELRVREAEEQVEAVG